MASTQPSSTEFFDASAYLNSIEPTNENEKSFLKNISGEITTFFSSDNQDKEEEFLDSLEESKQEYFDVKKYLDETSDEESVDLVHSQSDRIESQEDYFDAAAWLSGDTEQDKRTFAVADAEVEGVNNIFKLLEVIDRPRSAVIGGLIELLEQEELDWEAIRAEMGEGWRGEDHALMGEYLREKLIDVENNPD